MATATQKEQELSLFELAQKLLAEGRELLEQDLNNARQEKAALEEITKTLNEVHFANTIKLNVGGKIYKTTLDTLRKDPDSMLCAMFSGRFELKADEDDGAYFIDRDAELFRYILNYLRNGELFCPEDQAMRNELLAEARFYQLQGIITQLEEKREQKISVFEDSLIIEEESHKTALISWLPSDSTCTLLYRASADGSRPADFHRCCDNKGPTLVLIKSGEYILGGYTSQSWESLRAKGGPVTEFKTDPNALLLSLVNPSGSEPNKMNAKVGFDVGIICGSNLGPCFGVRSRFNFKTHGIESPYNYIYKCQVYDTSLGFQCPANVDFKTYFTGSNDFTISELEVFKVDF